MPSGCARDEKAPMTRVPFHPLLVAILPVLSMSPPTGPALGERADRLAVDRSRRGGGPAARSPPPSTANCGRRRSWSPSCCWSGGCRSTTDGSETGSDAPLTGSRISRCWPGESGSIAGTHRATGLTDSRTGPLSVPCRQSSRSSSRVPGRTGGRRGGRSDCRQGSESQAGHLLHRVRSIRRRGDDRRVRIQERYRRVLAGRASTSRPTADRTT